MARISKGLQTELYLGNLDARRDWGYAPEYVVAMWQMLQQSSGDDYVIGTGTDLSVQDFVEMAFAEVNLNWQDYVRFDERYLRPTEVDSLVGDASKAKKAFNFETSVKPDELARIMVKHDLEILNGYKSDKPQGLVWQKALS